MTDRSLNAEALDEAAYHAAKAKHYSQRTSAEEALIERYEEAIEAQEVERMREQYDAEQRAREAYAPNDPKHPDYLDRANDLADDI